MLACIFPSFCNSLSSFRDLYQSRWLRHLSFWLVFTRNLFQISISIDVYYCFHQSPPGNIDSLCPSVQWKHGSVPVLCSMCHLNSHLESNCSYHGLAWFLSVLPASCWGSILTYWCQRLCICIVQCDFWNTIADGQLWLPLPSPHLNSDLLLITLGI